MRALRLVILGRQGSGKGTQALRISETFGCIHISTGDMLRAAVAAGSELGRQAEEVMNAGGLVGDDIMNGIVAERLGADDIMANGVLLDGFPRTSDQADALERICADQGVAIDRAINLDVPVDVVRERMVARGREDDTPEAIDKRLALYEEQTAPLLDWFGARDLLTTVDGVGSEDDVFERISAVIGR
ncbi:MAG: adenylate kinase [Acidimicrobiales bacterium]|nr:MAG: adenylate kinase [Acidimicrobiales bacterium]